MIPVQTVSFLFSDRIFLSDFFRNASLREKVQHLKFKTLTKTIEVRGGSSYECMPYRWPYGGYGGNLSISENCTQTCAYCRGGMRQCHEGTRECVDCVFDSDFITDLCTDNYNCAECESNGDCNDDNTLTKDICSNFTGSNTLITQCSNDDFYCPSNCDISNDNDCGNRCGTQITDCGYTKLKFSSTGEEIEIINESNYDCFTEKVRNCCLAKLDFTFLYSKTYIEIKSLKMRDFYLFSK